MPPPAIALNSNMGRSGTPSVIEAGPGGGAAADASLGLPQRPISGNGRADWLPQQQHPGSAPCTNWSRTMGSDRDLPVRPSGYNGPEDFPPPEPTPDSAASTSPCGTAGSGQIRAGLRIGDSAPKLLLSYLPVSGRP